MLEHIRYDLGYERSLKKMSEHLGFNFENLIDIVDVLSLIARHTSTMVEFAGRLQHLENLARSSHMKNGIECNYINNIAQFKRLGI